MAILQGSNNPLVIQFDADISNIPVLVISLWCDKLRYAGKALKTWETQDIQVSGDTAICQLTESETAKFPDAELILEAKGLDANNNTMFWDQYTIDVKGRHDKVIRLMQTEG